MTRPLFFTILLALLMMDDAQIRRPNRQFRINSFIGRVKGKAISSTCVVPHHE
jgi:hypothetical protein